MPDGSWKATGSCTNSYKGGDKSYETYEEGSHLKEYTYKKTGGTGKFEGVSGGGTYMYDGLTDTIFWRQVPRHASSALVRAGSADLRNHKKKSRSVPGEGRTGIRTRGE